MYNVRMHPFYFSTSSDKNSYVQGQTCSAVTIESIFELVRAFDQWPCFAVYKWLTYLLTSVRSPQSVGEHLGFNCNCWTSLPLYVWILITGSTEV